MVLTSTLGTHHIGIIFLPQSKEPYHVLQYNRTRLNKSSLFQRLHTRISKRSGHHLYAGRMGLNDAASGQNYQQPSFNDEWRPEPFFLNLIKETFRGLRSLLIFLVEQPSQLKYIEWPSFQSTLKTASLALVLVALLIVALASVDSALSYVLTLLIRRTS